MRAGQNPGLAYFRALGSNPHSVNSLMFLASASLSVKWGKDTKFGRRLNEAVDVKGAEHLLFPLLSSLFTICPS